MNEKFLVAKNENVTTYESVEKQLHEIDWETLRSVFSEELNGAGLDGQLAEQMVSMDRVHINEDSSEFMIAGGWYDPISKQISLLPNAILRNAREIYGDSEIDTNDPRFKRILLGLLVHEQTHSLPQVEIDEKSMTVGFQTIQYENIDGIPSPTEDLGGGSLNEATTDMIAAEIFDEYAKRVGLDTDPYLELYTMPILLNEFFLNYIANASNVPRDIVWKGLKEAYFKGTDLSKTELGSVFHDIYEKLSQLDGSVSERTALKLIKEMSPTEIALDSKERIERGLREIVKYYENDIIKSEEHFENNGGFEEYADYYNNMRREAEQTIAEIEDLQAKIEKKFRA